MPAKTLRLYLIGALVVAGVLSVVGKKSHSPVVGFVSVAAFLCAVGLYFAWRRAALRERRARVFDREAKTDETRTRPDQ
jgi:uncharacterized membrane protein YfcA